jgi:hypothetical protein
MNEQEFADLFSEQLDWMLQGNDPAAVPPVDDLAELLNLGDHLSRTQFQASSVAQAAFQSHLAGWFSLANGGSPMTILGLSKAWFISIIVTTVVVIAGLGAIVVLVNTVSVIVPVGQGTPAPTDEATVEPTDEATAEPTDEATDEATAEPTAEPTDEATPEPTGEPDDDIDDRDQPPPTIIFVSNITIITLCQGAYSTSTSVVNYGQQPLTDAGLVWEVIEGAEFVEQVNVASDSFATDPGNNLTLAAGDDSPIEIQPNFANFSQIDIDQEVDLDVQVEVNDDWWSQPDGSEIRVRLSVENRIEINSQPDNGGRGDHNRGHGNDRDRHDDDNPGRGRQQDADADADSTGQVITIVKQGSSWVTLRGPVHPFDDQSVLIDGSVVVITNCTGQPTTIPDGSDVEIIGEVQPDGTIVAINITIIDITIINGDLDSGVPGADDGDDGGSEITGGGGGGSRGGSRGDHDRGHGNDADGHDEDNPGRSRGGSGGS